MALFSLAALGYRRRVSEQSEAGARGDVPMHGVVAAAS